MARMWAHKINLGANICLPNILLLQFFLSLHKLSKKSRDHFLSPCDVSTRATVQHSLCFCHIQDERSEKMSGVTFIRCSTTLD